MKVSLSGCCAVLLLCCAALLYFSCGTAETDASLRAAREVIDRFTGGTMDVRLELVARSADSCDTYTYAVRDGVLTVKGSSGVALCRGFYAYVKAHGAGISSWSGNRFVKPEAVDEDGPTVTSPFRFHQTMNVVTYGYTMPYWDEARWDREIDWMALHGVDMPLCLTAQEAVYRMVFKDMGLSDEEIDEWLTGPAHLPWMRMGNLSGNSMDGPLSPTWDKQQIALTRHLIRRMKDLGMTPIFPAFGGFVPRAFLNHYAEKADTTGWDWVKPEQRNTRIRPESPYFVEIGRRFIEKWEETFGAGQYYLSDSFNEMIVPQDKDLLTAYGDSIFKSIHLANEKAVWVMQGWTLGYQAAEWDEGMFEALVRNIPDRQMMILDMATDYNRYIWQTPYNWDTYPAFYGKQWVWSVIPNMGGKTAMTGVLDYYANGRLDALRARDRGNLLGYGFAPEGIENNELVYELIADGGWTSDSISLDEWLDNYARCRYGTDGGGDGVRRYYDGLRHSLYSRFTDHPRYGWQMYPYTGVGTVGQDSTFYAAVEALFEETPRSLSPLLLADMTEAAAFYAAGRVEELCRRARQTLDEGRSEETEALLQDISRRMMQLDAALQLHPNYRLSRWEEQAMQMGTSIGQQNLYARNARRLVTTWIAPHRDREPVNDYSARLWSGPVRDYYLPRLQAYFQSRLRGEDPSPAIARVENSFVEIAPLLTEPLPIETDTLTFLRSLLH